MTTTQIDERPNEQQDDDDVVRAGLRDFDCETCGERRNLLDFYDDTHKVWLTVDGKVHIDHGEADPNG